MSISVHAPAKVNLALHVVGQRQDGYHLLETLVVFTAFGDVVHVAPASEDIFEVTGTFADFVPREGSNLVLRARDLLRARHPRTAFPVAIRLHKSIPVASGVGGGSTDAAAALKALAGLWGTREGDLAALAEQLGADVPMCLAAQPLIARGIGEILEPASMLPPMALVLVNPGVAISTPTIFRALKSKHNAPLPPLPRSQGWAPFCDWLGEARNDLQPPACETNPIVTETIEAIAATGAVHPRMSGSGATCFGLFATLAEASAAARQLGSGRPGWFVEATALKGKEHRADAA